MRKLAVCFIFYLFIFFSVCDMELNFDSNSLDIKSFLTSCLEQVADKATQSENSNEIKLRFLDESTGKQFFINYTYGYNVTESHPNKRLAVEHIPLNDVFEKIIRKNVLVISDNSVLLQTSIRNFPVIGYSRFIGNLFKLIHSYKPNYIFYMVQDDLYDINNYCKYSEDKYCKILWFVFTKDEIPDNTVSNLNVKKVKIIIDPTRIGEQICNTVNKAVNYIYDSKPKLFNFTEKTLNFALSQFSTIFPDLDYEINQFNISGQIITGINTLYDKLDYFLSYFDGKNDKNHDLDFLNNFFHKDSINDILKDKYNNRKSDKYKDINFDNIFHVNDDNKNKRKRSTSSDDNIITTAVIDCNGVGIMNPNNSNECITGPRQFKVSEKHRKVNDYVVYICQGFAGITAMLCLISGIIFFLIRNKKGFQYQDWKMTECIILGLLIEVCPTIYVLLEMNDYSRDNSLIPMELLYLVYEMTIGGFYLPVYRVYKRVRLSQRYENLKKKARMLMDDEKDGQNSPSSHSMKGSARDQVIPINPRTTDQTPQLQQPQQPDSENSSSNKSEGIMNNNNNMLMNNQSSSTNNGVNLNNNNNINTPSTMSHMSGMPGSSAAGGGIGRAPGQMLGGMPRPIIDLVAVGDSDSNKLRRGEWFEYLCWVFIALVVSVLGIIIQPTKSVNRFDNIEVATNELFDKATETWNIQHYFYVWNVELKLDGVFVYIILGLCVIHSLVMIFMCLYMVRFGDNLNPYEYSILTSYYLLLSAWAGIIATLIRFSDSPVISVLVITIWVCAYALLCLYVMFYPTMKYMAHKANAAAGVGGGGGGGMKCQECGFDLKPPDINGNDLNSEVAQFEEEPEGGAAQQPRKSVIRSFFNKLSMRPGQYNRSMVLNGASSRSVIPRSVIE